VFAKLSADYGLDEATDIVIAGSSAGGLAVFLHSSYFHRIFDGDRTKLVLLPSGGFFARSNGHRHSTRWADRMKYAFSMQNGTSSIVDSQCLAKHRGDESECVFPGNLIRDVMNPMFILNSQFDEWQSVHILGTAAMDEALLTQFGHSLARFVAQRVMPRDNIFGAFIDGCYHHSCWRPARWNNLYIDGYTAASAFTHFYTNLDLNSGQTRRWWYQNVTFPCLECECPDLK